jgi:hypothetical protein
MYRDGRGGRLNLESDHHAATPAAGLGSRKSPRRRSGPPQPPSQLHRAQIDLGPGRAARPGSPGAQPGARRSESAARRPRVPGPDGGGRVTARRPGRGGGVRARPRPRSLPGQPVAARAGAPAGPTAGCTALRQPRRAASRHTDSLTQPGSEPAGPRRGGLRRRPRLLGPPVRDHAVTTESNTQPD